MQRLFDFTACEETEVAWSVYVTRRVPETGLELLRKNCETVDVYSGETAPGRGELLEGVRGRDGVLCLLSDQMDAEVMEAAGANLRVIANYAVGYDNIDVDAATGRGIAVTNTPGVLTETTADLAWALLFAAARRIPEADRYTRTGKWPGWGPMQMLGVDVTGATLGIVGAGRIGSAMARKSAGFGMSVLYHGHNDRPELERQLGARRAPLEEILKNSDFVSLHVPLTEQTHHLIGREELRWMKQTAVLVNTSRGAVVDEGALVEALREGQIFAAGLDVYEEEPELTPGLAELDNVVLTPHIGSGSRRTRAKMAQMAATGLITVLEGGRPENCVNPDVFG
jgi:lactate dehydrogenase-like 2-hydroxyacid dehydrogenase